MKRIGLLSDTHGYWDDRYKEYFAECDEIWHAGDIGTMELAERLAALKPFRAVYGKCEGADVLMKHIGGHPGAYDRSVRDLINRRPPKLFISGHSHILKVEYDKSLKLLHINPGAAGLQGWQTVRTLVRFTADEGEFKDLEVIEIPR